MLITTTTNTASKLRLQDIVLYDHQGVMAINKPAGVFARGAVGAPSVTISVSGLLEQARNDQWPDPHHVVHRLDEHTTGIMLVARDKDTARCLSQQFEAREIKKTYWALLDGKPSQAAGIINQPVSILNRAGELESKPAVTEYHTMETNSYGLSFMCLKPHTGRTHQLRIHAARSLGAPIIGDRQYHPDFADLDTGAGLVSAYTRAILPPEVLQRMQGQMLHARSITFTHPRTGEETMLEAPLPPPRQYVWGALGFQPRAFE